MNFSKFILKENPIQTQYNKVIEKIIEERKNNKMSQRELGEKIGISQNAYYKIEKRKTKLDLYRFLHIVSILRIDVKEMFILTTKKKEI